MATGMIIGVVVQGGLQSQKPFFFLKRPVVVDARPSLIGLLARVVPASSRYSR
jgi:hypothetical protein